MNNEKKIGYSPIEIGEAICNGYFEIPPIQRGLVWNATQIEVLWDSILRGIPVGAIGLRREGNKFLVLDGQQRANAITRAFLSYPSNRDCEEKKLESILWIDLGYQQTEEDAVKVNRKYMFRVTTAAHPWGYVVSKDETSSDVISVSTQRDACAQLCTSEDEYYQKNGKPWECYVKIGESKPYPFELFPVKDTTAVVPFEILFEFARMSGNEIEVETFEKYVSEKHSECIASGGMRCFKMFMRNVKDDVTRNKVSNVLKDVVDRIKGLDRYEIMCVSADSVDYKDIATYFERLNCQGKKPEKEDIMYSMLKQRVYDSCGGIDLRKVIDDGYARGLAHPPRLASIALRAWAVLDDMNGNDGHRIPTADSVIKRVMMHSMECEDLKIFLTSKLDSARSFGWLIRRVDEKIFDNKIGVLHWHRTRFTSEYNGDAYLLLLIMCSGKICEYSPRECIMVATWIMIFSCDSKSQAAKNILEALLNGKSLKEAIVSCIRNCQLLLPPLKSEVDAIADCVDSRDDSIPTFNAARNLPGFKTRWAAFANSFRTNVHAQHLVLYVVRRFMERIFTKYNSTMPQWQEQNCPWDWDHILPDDWIRTYYGCKPYVYCERYNQIGVYLKNTIGNCAPLPFSVNRRKQNNPPGASYPFGEDAQEMQKALAMNTTISPVLSAYNKDGVKYYDGSNNKERFLLFYKATVLRTIYMYNVWAHDVGFYEWFNCDEIVQEDVFCRTIVNLKSKLDVNRIEMYYYHDDGYDIPIKGMLIHLIIHEWIALESKISDSLYVSVYLSREGGCEIGLRRSPNRMRYETDREVAAVKAIELEDAGFQWTDNGEWYWRRYWDKAPSEGELALLYSRLMRSTEGFSLEK